MFAVCGHTKSMKTNKRVFFIASMVLLLIGGCTFPLTEANPSRSRVALASPEVPRKSSPQVWRDTDRTRALERLFIEAVRPQISAALAGVYGGDIQYWKEKVTTVEELTKSPNVLRVLVEVETFFHAHYPRGIDTIEFTLEPPGLRISQVKHKPHPQYQGSATARTGTIVRPCTVRG